MIECQWPFIKPERISNARHYGVAILGDMTSRLTAVNIDHVMP